MPPSADHPDSFRPRPDLRKQDIPVAFSDLRPQRALQSAAPQPARRAATRIAHVSAPPIQLARQVENDLIVRIRDDTHKVSFIRLRAAAYAGSLRNAPTPGHETLLTLSYQRLLLPVLPPRTRLREPLAVAGDWSSFPAEFRLVLLAVTPPLSPSMSSANLIPLGSA